MILKYLHAQSNSIKSTLLSCSILSVLIRLSLSFILRLFIPYLTMIMSKTRAIIGAVVVVVSVLDSFFDGFKDLSIVREVQCLKYKWEWSVIATHSLDGSLQVVKCLLLNLRCQLGSISTSHGRLMGHNTLSSFLDRVDHCFLIPWKDST